ncbi:MAG: 1-deoxy-D-xylulose-5-phosphate synthase [Phycisphaerae bacterium]|nr:1-deoxy-D-xylulose-5-phosphate synthase [Phycisphaerae bacterium]
MKDESLLQRVQTPHQLRRMSMKELERLAEALRERIIQVVSRNGGHLASNLGIAELTIALHYVFDFSRDRLLWDVGHQCYAHKILTGRDGRFDTLRRKDGLSGFPSPAESHYDLFATGHAGAAISTAVGLAWSDQQARRDTNVVAVVGDASIVNGLSLEGLNNAGMLRRQFLVVLNDNSMAIDRTHGALADVLERVRMDARYGDLKATTEQLLHRLPMGGEIKDALRHIKEGLRTTLHGPKVFETLGFNYFGPISGHDVATLIRVLERIRQMPYPTVLHVHTEKGRGCAYAVDDPCRFHSPAAYTIRDGKAVFPLPSRPTWTRAFTDALAQQARRDDRVVAITAAMADGTGLAEFRNEFPDRTFDVGISESHAVAMAAGLAKGGRRPVVAIYSTFMQRAFDQVFEEICLQKLPVVLCMDRAGLVGSDGAVHHGFADIAYLRPLPGMVLAAPADEAELRAALDFALRHDGPVAIRYPRDEVPPALADECPPFELTRARVLREGPDATILAYGAMVAPAMAAAEYLADARGIRAAVVNARFAKPLDTATIGRCLAGGAPMVVVEDHAKIGGLGSAVLELAAERDLRVGAIRCLGIPDRFVVHASRDEQLEDAGLTTQNIAETVCDLLAHTPHTEKENTNKTK